MRFPLLLMLTLVMVVKSFEIKTNSPLSLRNRKSDQLNGVNLKFILFHVPPFDIVTLGADGNYSDTGINSRSYNWLAEKLNFTISYVLIPNERTRKKYGNVGDVALVMKIMADKDVDASAPGFIQTPERKKWADFVYFITAEPQAMVVPRPGEEPRLFAFIRPFQSSVWLLILISSIVVVVSMCLFSKAYSKLFNNKGVTEVPLTNHPTALEWAGRYSTYIVNILTNQGNNVAISGLSFQILVGTWLLIATVLVNSYSSTVISYLTVPKMKPPINTLDDLASSKDIKLILLADTLIAQQIEESKSGPMKILGDQIRSNPDQVLNNVSLITERMQNEHSAFPFLQTISKNIVVGDFKKTGKCRFKTTDPITSFQYWCIPLQKNSKFTAVFSKAMLELEETGLPSFWKKTGMSSAPKCFAKEKSDATSRQVPIRLNDLTGAFFILGIGFCLSLLAFLLEKILHFRSRRQLGI